MFERVTGITQYGLGIALMAGQSLIKAELRHQQGLDNIVRDQRTTALSDIEHDRTFFASARRDETPDEDLQAEHAALVEISALQQFCSDAAPQTHAELDAIDIHAPPDPQALRALMFYMRHAEHQHRVQRD